MATMKDRPNIALLIVDVQNGVVAEAYERDSIVANIRELVTKARRQRAAIIWVQHESEQLQSGSDPWQIVPELLPDSTEPLLEKQHGDAFEDTRLAAVLAELDVGHVVVAGAQTDACVRSTIHGAFVRGYDTTLVSDAHTTEDLSKWGAPLPKQVIAHTNLYWAEQRAPGRKAAAVKTADVDFAS